MKFLITWLLLFTTVATFGQSENKDVLANTMTGVIVESNLIRNPVARFGSTKYRTLSNATVGLGTMVYDNYGSWAVQATATSGYVEWDMLTPSDEHKAGNCAYAASFNGTAANYKLQILDGSAVELANRQLTDVTASTDVAVYYPCGASRKVRVTYTSTGTGATFDIGRLQYGRYLGPSIMATRTAEAAYTPTYTGFGTVVTSNMKWYQDGAYLYIYGTFTTATATGVEARMSLPTGYTSSSTISTLMLCGDLGQVASSTTFFRNSVLCEPSVAYVTFGYQSSTTNMVTKALGSSFANSAVVQVNAKIPIAGASNVNAIPASCIANAECVNNFSAKVSATGVVTDENYDFINGNCTSGSPSTCTWVTSRFGVTPNCQVTPVYTNFGSGTISSASTTNIIVRTQNSSTGGGLDQPFVLTCSRAGTDVKPWGPIPLLTGMVSADDTASVRASWVFFGTGTNGTTACSATPCTVYLQIGTNITSVVWEATGIYRIMGVDGTKSACMGTGLGGGVPITFIMDKDTSTTTYARLLARNPSGTATNSAYNSVNCGEKRP